MRLRASVSSAPGDGYEKREAGIALEITGRGLASSARRGSSRPGLAGRASGQEELWAQALGHQPGGRHRPTLRGAVRRAGAHESTAGQRDGAHRAFANAALGRGAGFVAGDGFLLSRRGAGGRPTAVHVGGADGGALGRAGAGIGRGGRRPHAVEAVAAPRSQHGRAAGRSRAELALQTTAGTLRARLRRSEDGLPRAEIAFHFRKPVAPGEAPQLGKGIRRWPPTKMASSSG